MSGKTDFVKNEIMQRIQDGVYPLGAQLPTEPELATLFRVSRGTVRQALSDLADMGLVARRAGAGTFVIRKLDAGKSPAIISMSEQIRQQGMQSTTEVISQRQIMANQIAFTGSNANIWREAYLLNDAEAAHTPVYEIVRLRLRGEQPVAAQTIYLRAKDFNDDLLSAEDFTQSVFKIYQQYHRRVTWADETIRARRPTAKEEEVLQMASLPEAKKMVYQRNRISYDEQNVVLEVMESIDRSDFFERYRYRIVEDTLLMKKEENDRSGRIT